MLLISELEHETTIGQLIPSLINVDHNLKNMSGLSQTGNLLCHRLRNEIKHRFDYEFKFPIYRVISIY